MSFDEVVLIGLYAFVAYSVYKGVIGVLDAKRQTVKEETSIDLAEFIDKIQKEYNFGWKSYEDNKIEAYVCGKTGYVFAKILHNDPFFTAYLKGELMGDYLTAYDARKAIEARLKLIGLMK